MEKEYLGYYMIKSGKCSKLYEKELFRFNKKNEKKDYIFFHNHNSPKFYPSIQDIFLILLHFSNEYRPPSPIFFLFKTESVQYATVFLSNLIAYRNEFALFKSVCTFCTLKVARDPGSEVAFGNRSVRRSNRFGAG